MERKTILVLSLEEAKKELADYNASALAADKELIMEHMLEGTLGDFNLKNERLLDVCTQLRELDALYDMAKSHDPCNTIDMIFVKEGDKFDCAWKKEWKKD